MARYKNRQLGLPLLERQRQLDFVSTVAHISLIAQALGGIPGRREGPQAGQGESIRRSDRQESQQEGSRQTAPQTETGQRSDSQDFIPLSFAQMQGDEDRNVGEISFMREQMRRAGTLLQERVAQEQRQQRAAPARRHTAITEELSIERQARRLAERRVAELEQQMARMRSLAQELEHRQGLRGQQTAPLIPRPLQVGAGEQRRPGEQRRDGLPQMATKGVQP